MVIAFMKVNWQYLQADIALLQMIDIEKGGYGLERIKNISGNC